VPALATEKSSGPTQLTALSSAAALGGQQLLHRSGAFRRFTALLSRKCHEQKAIGKQMINVAEK
jgi:hypothetical protein